jgi:hypothetical protein
MQTINSDLMNRSKTELKGRAEAVGLQFDQAYSLGRLTVSSHSSPPPKAVSKIPPIQILRTQKTSNGMHQHSAIAMSRICIFYQPQNQQSE